MHMTNYTIYIRVVHGGVLVHILDGRLLDYEAVAKDVTAALEIVQSTIKPK